MARQQMNRRLRFSLCSLFVALFILCVMLGMKVNRVKQQQKAIAWIYDMNGEIQFDYEISDDHNVPMFGQQPPGPQWLHSLVGVDFFRTPHFVVLRGATDLSPLAKLTELRGLSVESGELTDLAPLAELTKLKRLTVASDQLGNVSPLAKLSDLESLGLFSRQVIDLSPLADLSNLERLLLRGDQHTDLSPLSTLTNLKELFIDTSLGSDEQVARLKEALPNCIIIRAPIEFQ